MSGSKISVHNLEKRVVGQRDVTRNGDVRGSKLVKLNIRTPMIRPDRECPVQYFENNLIESISLLAGVSCTTFTEFLCCESVAMIKDDCSGCHSISKYRTRVRRLKMS